MFRSVTPKFPDMSTALLLHRLRLRKPAGPTTLRVDVCPPDVCPSRDSLWTAALRWLVGNDTEAAPSLRTPLERARVEFVGALGGLLHLDSADLLCRARHARSLRELWHLRSELYTLVAKNLSQPEADTRLAKVNQHFPTRTQRTAIQATEVSDVQ
jgi:hypothetical protein